MGKGEPRDLTTLGGLQTLLWNKPCQASVTCPSWLLQGVKTSTDEWIIQTISFRFFYF